MRREAFLAGMNWGGDVSASQSPAMQAAQNSAQVFLGANLRCASCHDSFVSRWKLSQTFGLAAYFTADRLEIARCEVKTGVRRPCRPFSSPSCGTASLPAELAERRRQVARMITSAERTDGSRPHWSIGIGSCCSAARWWSPWTTSKRPAWDADLLNWLAADFMRQRLRYAETAAADRDVTRVPDAKRYPKARRPSPTRPLSSAVRCAGGFRRNSICDARVGDDRRVEAIRRSERPAGALSRDGGASVPIR